MNKEQVVAHLRRLKETDPVKFQALRERARAELEYEKQRVLEVEERKRREVEEHQRRFQQVRTALTVTGTPSIDLSQVEGMVAFRKWDLDGDSCLRSTAYSQHVWGPWKIADRIPTRHNTNGLYCVKLDSWGLINNVGDYLGDVCGLVELRGDVVEHSDGILRAEWARVLCIFVTIASPDTYDIVPALYCNYPTVPIHVIDPTRLAGVLLRVTVWQEMRGDVWPEADEVRAVSCLPTEGTICSAEWCESEATGKLYVNIVISVKPFIFNGREVGRLFSQVAINTTYFGILQAVAGSSLGESVASGESLPELVGRKVSMDIGIVEFEGVDRLRTRVVG